MPSIYLWLLMMVMVITIAAAELHDQVSEDESYDPQGQK